MRQYTVRMHKIIIIFPLFVSLKTGNIAYHAYREVAFLKNRTSFYFVIGMIILAIIGVASRLISNPSAFFQSVLVFLVIGFAIFFLVRRFNGATPQKREQSAFRKAAKKSKKRLRK